MKMFQFFMFYLAVLPLLMITAHSQTKTPDLNQTALLLEEDMKERFMIEGQIAPKLRLPTEQVPFVSYNMPDNAYMTGMYLASQTYRWLAEPSPEAKKNAKEACEALHKLIEVTGKPGLFARSFLPWDMQYHDDGEWHRSADRNYRWRGDVSSDQVDGYMYGCSVYAEHLASEEEIKRMAEDCAAICTHIEENGMKITDVDGEPTLWGRYDWDYVTTTEPMNALLWLQHLKVTAQLTKDPKWEEKYREFAIDKKYAEIASKAYSGEPGLDGEINHSDITLHFLAYEPLFRLEKDEAILPFYQKSLDQSWEYIQKINQPYFTYLYAAITGKRDLPHLEKVTENLKSFTFDIYWNKATRDRYAKKYDLDLEPTKPDVLPKDGEPLPYAWWDKTWSILVHDPYQVPATTIPRPDAGMEYTGLHWTISYWLGRAEGFISEDE